MDYYLLELPDHLAAVKEINNYINKLTIRKLSKSTLDIYSSEAINLLSIFKPEDLNTHYLHEYIKDFGDISISLKNTRYTAIRAVLKYLVKKGFYNCDIELLSIKQTRKIPKYLSELDMNIMIKKFQNKKSSHNKLWIGRRDYALLMILYATGMRADEIVRFKIQDLQNGWIRIENSKGGKDRYVPLAPKAEKAIKEYLEYLPHKVKTRYQELFFTDDLVPFSRNVLWHYCKKKFGINPHLFRHTFASHLAINGCNISVLSDFLGHVSLSTTQIYTHIQNYHLHKTVNTCHPIALETK